MRLFFRAAVCALAVSAVLSMAGFCGACEDIRQEVFRLHIIANSDSVEDQALKLRVRDRLLEYTGGLFSSCRDKNGAMAAAKEHLDEIKSFAESVVRQNGSDYTVDASVTRMNFDTRVYDGITLPAGEYDALRITLGKGAGHNWWCVLFPALCLPGARGDELGSVMNDREFDIVSGGDRYEIKFFFVEWIESLFSALHR